MSCRTCLSLQGGVGGLYDSVLLLNVFLSQQTASLLETCILGFAECPVTLSLGDL